VYHVYAIRTPDRSKLQSALHEQGVQTGIHYPFPVHLLEAHADLGYHVGDFPVSEQLAAEELSLPMYAELTDEQINTVCTAVRNYAQT
jgi:dTDP-4-amino-4,6-dideoxygalactose transaminase